MNIIKIKWSDFHQDCYRLATLCKGLRNSPTTIVAISRGGLIPATILSNELRIDRMKVIEARSYTGRNRGQLELSNPDHILLELQEVGGQVLIVDDLVDTGNTMKAVKAIFPHAMAAVVYAKPTGMLSVDAFAKQYTDEVWLQMPWERPE